MRAAREEPRDGSPEATPAPGGEVVRATGRRQRPDVLQPEIAGELVDPPGPGGVRAVRKPQGEPRQTGGLEGFLLVSEGLFSHHPLALEGEHEGEVIVHGDLAGGTGAHRLSHRHDLVPGVDQLHGDDVVAGQGLLVLLVDQPYGLVAVVGSQEQRLEHGLRVVELYQGIEVATVVRREPRFDPLHVLLRHSSQSLRRTDVPVKKARATPMRVYGLPEARICPANRGSSRILCRQRVGQRWGQARDQEHDRRQRHRYGGRPARQRQAARPRDHLRLRVRADQGVRGADPAGSAGNVDSEVSMSAEVCGLQPETTYHFRVVATNSKGTVRGPDKSFTTLVAPERPRRRLGSGTDPGTTRHRSRYRSRPPQASACPRPSSARASWSRPRAAS